MAPLFVLLEGVFAVSNVAPELAEAVEKEAAVTRAKMDGAASKTK